MDVSSAPPSSDATASAARGDDQRRHQRGRSGRGRKNHAAAGENDAVDAVNDGATGDGAANAKPAKDGQQRKRHDAKPRNKDERGETPRVVDGDASGEKKRGPREKNEKKDNKQRRTDGADAETPPLADGNARPPRQKRERNKQKAVETTGDDEIVEDEAEAIDWSTAAWFTGCDADLGVAYWLLTRAHACNDTVVLSSEAIARRAAALQSLLTQLKTELLPLDDEHPDETNQKQWTTGAIVDAAVAALAKNDDAARSKVVTVLESEVVDAATELVLSRVGRDDIALLTRWDAFLGTLVPVEAKNEQTTVDETKADEDHDGSDGSDEEEAEEEDKAPIQNHEEPATEAADAGAAVLPPPRQRKRRGAVNAIALTKAFVAAAIAFHRQYAQRVVPVASASDPAPAAVATWTSEIVSIVDATIVTPADEATRQAVATQLQTAFRRSPNWKEYEVLLFGSSVSKFGSKSSDLDLCLRSTTVDPEDATAIMSVRELKLRMRRTQQSPPMTGDGSSTRNDDAPYLHELLTKSRKTVEGLINSVNKQRRKTANRSDGKVKKLEQMLSHWRALVVALAFFYEKVADAKTTSPNQHRAAADAAAAYHAAVRKQQKQRQQAIYAAAAFLERHGCDIDLVVAHARVPVIGFTHRASGFECDLCFGNYHACINTQLLRTYAEVDNRARLLGMAIKHWAKRRGLNDASLGYLSSYSFILLVIYFLQHKVGILPNLQDPELLRVANVAPMTLNGVDVSFCADVQQAKPFHKVDNDDAVGTLLLSFFQFYVEEFDFSQHVVSVRHPKDPMLKLARWGHHKLKAWRVSIEDPLEMDRDLGSVLQFRCQQRILEEMHRALTLLREGQSFEAVVCEADPDAVKNETAKKTAKKDAKKQAKKQGGNKRDDRKKPEGQRNGNGDRQARGGRGKREQDGPKSHGEETVDGKKPSTASNRRQRDDRAPKHEVSGPPRSHEQPAREKRNHGGAKSHGEESADGKRRHEDAGTPSDQASGAQLNGERPPRRERRERGRHQRPPQQERGARDKEASA